MYKRLLFIVCVAVVTASCLKNNTTTGCRYQPRNVTVPAAEQTALDTYIDTNNIVAVKHPTGYYYQIVSAGTGSDSVTLCSLVQLTYKGQLANNAVFDQRTNIVYELGSLIEGWRRAIPMIKRGGEINLYIPPSLGYGGTDIVDSGRIVIPKNSILKCNIKLTDYTAGN